jgi:protein TonB
VAFGQKEGWLHVYWQHSIAGIEQRPLSWFTVAWVALLHVLVLLLLLTRQEATLPVEEAPLIVHLIEQVQARPDTQPVALLVRESLPKPLVKQRQPSQRPMPLPTPVVDAPIATTAPSPVSTIAPAESHPVEAPVAKADPQPVAAPARTEPSPKEESVDQPRFDADYLDNPSPGYPPLSRKLREEGQVLLRVRVTAEGRPEQVNLHRSSGFDRLDERAINTVRQWKFMPARLGGKPVDAWVIVPIQFSLKG